MAQPERVTAELLHAWPLPTRGTDKESRGRVLVVGGSGQTPGAVVLAGEAVLRAGGGKLQLATAASVATAVAVAVPEARVLPLPQDDDGALLPAAAEAVVATADDAAVVLVGPGLRDVAATVALLEAVMPSLGPQVVVDALATAYLTRHPDGLRHLGGGAVVTANPAETARMLEREVDEVEADPLGAATDLARRTGAVVLHGGSDKTVVTPDGRAWLVEEGGAGLAMSGSGDVAAGIVAGLLGRGADPAQAAVWGAWLHGSAGERLAAALGPVGFLARELPAQVPSLLAERGE